MIIPVYSTHKHRKHDPSKFVFSNAKKYFMNQIFKNVRPLENKLEKRRQN